MWTRAPSVTSDYFVAHSLALNREGAGEARPRFQAEVRELEDTEPSALDHIISRTLIIHHDLPEVADRFKGLPETGGFSNVDATPSYMSSSESISVSKVGLVYPVETSRMSVGCMRKERSQLDDMQSPIVNAHIPASDQELETLFWSLPSKRRKIVYNYADGLGARTALSESELAAEALTPEACQGSDLTAEQHMADQDSPKSSTLEDIDCAAHVCTSRGTTEVAAPQCSSGEKPVEQGNLDQVPARWQVDVHFSSEQNVAARGTKSPGCDDTHSASQILLSTGRTRKDSQVNTPTRNIQPESTKLQTSRKRKTMASGSGGWLQLSLGRSRQSYQSPEDEPVGEQLESERSPMQIPPSSSADPPQLGIRDFFKLGGSSEDEGTSRRHPADVHGSTVVRNTSSPYRAQPATSTHSGESFRRYPDINPESGFRSGLSRPLFLEPRPRSRDSSLAVPYSLVPRAVQPSPANVGNSEHFLSPSTPILQRGYPPPALTNLTTLPYHTAPVLQQVRSELTESAPANTWRSSGHQPSDSGAGSGSGQYCEGFQKRLSAPPSWMPSPQDPPRTPPNNVELLNTTNQTLFRDWSGSLPGSSGGASTSLLSVQPPLTQNVYPEAAWHNLLQRVGGKNLNMPSGFGTSPSSLRPGAESMMPGADREEYLEALKRAVERFQGTDQGSKDDPLTELQRMHRNAMYPPAQLQAGPALDPSTDTSLAKFFGTPSSSGSKGRAPPPVSSSEKQKRVLRPHAPRPGLWFTLQASNSQPEASPLQQIPAGYVRVVDDSMTVAAVKKYLVNKLGLDNEDEVELTCNGQPLVPSIPLQQVRDGIWQAPITKVANPCTSRLLSEGRAWKAPDGSVAHVGDVVMVITYGRRPERPPTSTSQDVPAKPS